MVVAGGLKTKTLDLFVFFLKHVLVVRVVSLRHIFAYNVS